MSDPSDARVLGQGSAADRKMTYTKATASGALVGAVIGICDWALIDCVGKDGHWHYVVPSRQLIETVAPLTALPLALFFGTVFGIIGDIVIHKLKKADGE